MEAHGTTVGAMYDRAKQSIMLETESPQRVAAGHYVVPERRHCFRSGVYGGLIDKFPIGAAFAKGLTLKMGQTHVHRYLEPLLNRIRNREIDPSFLITHRMRLTDAGKGYEIFSAKEDACVKVVMTP
jgi:threonine dehydrogenase-like Zn-dependent dehydrogenase